MFTVTSCLWIELATNLRRQTSCDSDTPPTKVSGGKSATVPLDHLTNRKLPSHKSTSSRSKSIWPADPGTGHISHSWP